LERHITLSRSLYGSDQAASLEPRGMKELITSLQIIIKAFGEEKLGFVTPEEKKVAIKLRAHIKQ
jgi:N-acetylneuraminate synthase